MRKRDRRNRGEGDDSAAAKKEGRIGLARLPSSLDFVLPNGCGSFFSEC